MFLKERYGTKEKIIDASIDLFAAQGYSETSMRQIAERTEIKASSIYNHFPSKYDILLEILKIYTDVLRKGVPRTAPVVSEGKTLSAEEISRLLFFSFPPEQMERFRKIQKIIYSEQLRNSDVNSFLQTEIIDNSYQHIRDTLSVLKAQGAIPPHDTAKLSSLLYTLMMSFTLFNIMNRPYMSAEDPETGMFPLITYLLQMVLDNKG